MSPRREREVACLQCEETFTVKRTGRRSHFCPACRVERNAERNREATARRMATLREARSNLALPTNMQERLDAVFLTLEPIEDVRLDLVIDRMPEGANSPLGPEDGMTTTWRDLAEWLDVRRAEAAAHSWWLAHPHWSYELHDNEEAGELLKIA